MIQFLRAAILALCLCTGVQASETINYKYDALGRLTKVEHSGMVNNGVVADYSYDKADNRQNVTVTGAATSSSVILRDSFDGTAVPLGHKSDGGWVAGSLVTNSPAHGSQALRLGMWGNHTFTIAGATFTAAQSTVTISIYLRDSGVTNASLTGGWSGSSADAAHPVMLGLYNSTTDSWALDAASDPSGGLMPPSSGQWVRHTRTISGLTVGHSYSVSIQNEAYAGVRASDVDALQVEYGTTATAYPGVATASPPILKDSFDSATVPFGHKSDGGWVGGTLVTNSPAHGSQALRLGMWGNHTFTIAGATFTAAQSTVTISIYLRDSGVTNASLTGGWSGSSADAAHPVMLGLYNSTTDSWTLDAASDPSGGLMPPSSGQWVRHTRTISGLTVGHSYSVSIQNATYDGVRASDVDALQVDYGGAATPFTP